jgi:hypothetical protein
VAARLRQWMHHAWRKLCPWDPGDFPELDALDCLPHRPPEVPRHRFGRRSECEDAELATALATKKKVSFSLTVPELTVSAQRR